MKLIHRDIKFHIENDKITFDEPTILTKDETLVIEEVREFPSGKIVGTPNCFIQTIDREGKPPKCTIKVIRDDNMVREL